MLDRHVEFTKHAQRRMDEDFKPIDDLLVKWAKEANYDGAPRWPAQTMLGRIIVQGMQGASQSGSPAAVLPRDVEIIDWCVAQLRDMKRKVIFVEYVQGPGWSKARKRARLHMSPAAWDRNLNGAREVIFTLYSVMV